MVQQHLVLCGAIATDAQDPAAIGLFIQVPRRPSTLPEGEANPLVESLRAWMDQGRPAALAHLAYINRMDPVLARAVVERLELTRLEGFAAWNTPANALGTVVALPGALLGPTDSAARRARTGPAGADDLEAILPWRLVHYWAKRLLCDRRTRACKIPTRWLGFGCSEARSTNLLCPIIWLESGAVQDGQKKIEGPAAIASTLCWSCLG